MFEFFPPGLAPRPSATATAGTSRTAKATHSIFKESRGVFEVSTARAEGRAVVKAGQGEVRDTGLDNIRREHPLWPNNEPSTYDDQNQLGLVQHSETCAVTLPSGPSCPIALVTGTHRATEAFFV